MVKWIPRSIICWGAKCAIEQSVLRSKMFQGAKGVKKQSVLRSKVFRGVKCSLKQSVLRSKVFWGAECTEKQGVMRSKRFWVEKGAKEQGVLRSKLWLCQVCSALEKQNVRKSKVFFGAKCALAFYNTDNLMIAPIIRVLKRKIDQLVMTEVSVGVLTW